MVYRCLDPGRDWDAWCDDHPDPPEFDVIDEECYVSQCCKCWAMPTAKKNVYICEDCGLFCSIDEDESVEKFMEKCVEDAAEAKAEAAYERMMDDY